MALCMIRNIIYSITAITSTKDFFLSDRLQFFQPYVRLVELVNKWKQIRNFELGYS